MTTVAWWHCFAGIAGDMALGSLVDAGADLALIERELAALPVGGWSIEPGLAYALTPADLPDTSQVLTPAGPGPASLVAHAVQLTTTGGTVHLGRLIASEGVRYVVLVQGLAPSTVGSLTNTGWNRRASAN